MKDGVNENPILPGHNQNEDRVDPMIDDLQGQHGNDATPREQLFLRRGGDG